MTFNYQIDISKNAMAVSKPLMQIFSLLFTLIFIGGIILTIKNIIRHESAERLTGGLILIFASLGMFLQMRGIRLRKNYLQVNDKGIFWFRDLFLDNAKLYWDKIESIYFDNSTINFQLDKEVKRLSLTNVSQKSIIEISRVLENLCNDKKIKLTIK